VTVLTKVSSTSVTARARREDLLSLTDQPISGILCNSYLLQLIKIYIGKTVHTVKLKDSHVASFQRLAYKFVNAKFRSCNRTSIFLFSRNDCRKCDAGGK
jgi:hypothetical protein